jgi:hypothetical protein
MPSYRPIDDRQLNGLLVQFEDARKRMDKLRKFRRQAVAEYAGRWFGEDSTQKEVVENLVNQAVRIYARHMAARVPRADVTTMKKGLRPLAATLREALNHQARESNLSDVMRRCVVEAMFTFGIVYTGMSPTGEVELDGVMHDVGQVSVQLVDLDDFVMDVFARTWDGMRFVGHRCTQPLDLVKEAGIFDVPAESLKAKAKSMRTEEGDTRTEAIAVGSDDPIHQFTEFMPMYEYWHLWLPFNNAIVLVEVDDRTSQAAAPSGRILKQYEYVGPEWGNYSMLGYVDVPGTLIPGSPIQALFDLHLRVNESSRKIWRQTKRQKTVLAVSHQAKEDGEKIVRAQDGEALAVDHVDAMKEVEFGGPSQSVFGSKLDGIRRFDQLGGNISTLGGLGASAPTLGQEQIIAGQAASLPDDMSNRTDEFAARVLRTVAWYLMHDPLIEIPLIKRVPGTSVEIPVVYTAEMIEGDFLDYNFRIEPMSMRPATPAQRASTLTNLMQTVIAPLLPLMEQQGLQINMEQLMRIYSDNLDLPELRDVIQFVSTDPTEQAVGQPSRGVPTFKQTVNTRVNRSTRTNQGTDYTLAETAMAGGKNGGDPLLTMFEEGG